MSGRPAFKCALQEPGCLGVATQAIRREGPLIDRVDPACDPCAHESRMKTALFDSLGAPKTPELFKVTSMTFDHLDSVVKPKSELN